MAIPSVSESLSAFDAGLDHFARLGLPRAYGLDRDALEDAYLALSRRYHPDRFAGADSGVRRTSMEWTSALNEAYDVLRDPVRRAEYLVKLAGIDLDSSDPETGAPAPGPTLLMEMIDSREELAARARDGVEALDEMRANVEERSAGLLRTARQDIEAGNHRDAARALIELRYLNRLLDEIDAAQDQH